MSRAIPILLYHGVDTDPCAGLAPYTMAPDRFEAHMDVVVDRGATTLTVSGFHDLVKAGAEVPPNAVVITFDDGLSDFADYAWPALERRALSATLYVVTGHIGGLADWLAPLGASPAMLDWDELRRLDRDGCEIGAHSVNHPQLDVLDDGTLEHEVTESRAELARQLGHPVRSFAYPHGYHGPRVERAVRRAGYDSACAVRNRLSSVDDNPFGLARVTVDASCKTDELHRILDGRDVRPARRRESVRTAGWRGFRRARSRLAAR